MKKSYRPRVRVRGNSDRKKKYINQLKLSIKNRKKRIKINKNKK